MYNRSPLAGIFTIFGMMLSHDVFAERNLVTHGDLVASAPDSFFCGRNANVVVRAPDATAFSGDRVELQKLIGGLRAILSFECPEAKEIRIIGKVNEQVVFSETVSEAARWKLSPGISTDTAVAPKDEGEQTRESGTQVGADRPLLCDELAAHPHDPNKLAAVPGVADDDLNPEAAIDACLTAIESESDEPRYKFQLARVLEAAGLSDDAADFYYGAALEGYPAAEAYLLVEEANLSVEDEYAALAKGDIEPTRCDELAAHPQDPDRPEGVSGVSDYELNPDAAIDACIVSLEDRPDDRRAKFQLGRALRAGGLEDDAAEYLKEAAEDGYSAAKAYLAGEYEDPVYSEAAGSPQLITEPAQDLPQSSKVSGSVFNPSGYIKPQIVKGIYAKDTSELGDYNREYTLEYLGNMLNTLGEACPGVFTEKQKIKIAASLVKEYVNPQKGAQILAQSLDGFLVGVRNPALFIDVENIWKNAMDDAFLFWERYACGPEVDTFVLNAQSYFLNPSVWEPRAKGPRATLQNPIITKKGIYTTIDYGDVEGVVSLPVPDPPPDTPFVGKRERQGFGLLWKYTVERAGIPSWVIGEYDGHAQNTIKKDITTFANGKNMIVCKYSTERKGTVFEYKFWYKKNPEGFSRRQLLQKVPKHPLADIGDAKSECPPTKQAAARG